ncbi:MAG: flagellar hook-length control protein FliK [Lachnospiraceae bacterium]|nr:flagellar hook-length control protein FliK [Lachnospiraceae bacterium]
MQVSDLVNQYQANLSNGGEVSAKTKTKGVEQLVSTLSKLQKGQVFEGTVNSIKGNQVILGLSSGQNITARLDGSVSLKIGESVFFQVKSNEDNTIQIKPVSIGSMNNPTLLNALDAAGMAVTEDSINMVNTMMKEQMPIDAKSLSEMARRTASNPGANVSTIVVMAKHNLPITQEMVNQFENYKSNEGQLLKAVDELGKSVTEVLSSEEVSEAKVLSFHKEMLSIISGDDTEKVSLNTQAQKLSELIGDGAKTIKVPSLNLGMEKKPEVTTQADNLKQIMSDNVQQEESLLVDGKEVMEGVTKGETVLLDEEGNIITPSKELVNELLQHEKSLVTVPNYNSEEFPMDSVGRALAPSDNSEISTILSKNTNFRAEYPEFFDENGALRPEVSAKTLMNSITEYFSSNPTALNQLKELVGKEGYGKLFANIMSETLSIEPEELTIPHRLDELYKEMDETVTRLANAASSITAKEDNLIVSSAQNIHDNLEFISQVNDLYTYVQIPLKLSGQEATGDLYVYRNKKQNKDDSDELTAFLHFDLEHLGSTDISVRMKNKNVSTKFYLEDDASYELIMNNIHILKENLDNLGYNCTVECENDSNPVDFVSDFLERDVKTAENISRYSFDVRA